MSTFNGKTVLYFPVVIGPITVSYNLSGLSKPLQLDATTIADIFEAKITTWNNSAITADNPGVTLPSTAITICRRSDSSGTTQNFSEFLVKGAPSVWTLGSSSTIKWPAASRGGSGNGGVASCIKSTSGAVGYVDYADAKASGLTFASVKNSSGGYVAPSPTSATAAADSVTVAANLTFSAIWAPGAERVPDHLSVLGSGLRDSAERERRGHAQGVHRLPDLADGRPETAPQPGLRAAALQPRLDGHGAAQQDHQLGVSVVMQDQIGSLS